MTYRLVLTQFVREDSGQDIIEYALLTAFIGCIGALAWQGVKTGLHNGYLGWDANAQTLSGCVPDPISEGGGGC